MRADSEHNSALFWALRGGSGNFGVVTALELRLLPIADAYAGMLLWDGAQAAVVCQAWADWTHGLAEEVTTSLRLLSLPPLPELPEFIRGRQLVVVDGAVLASDQRAAELLAPLRALQPELDTFARVPAAALSRIHMDPEGPTPGVSDHLILDDVDATAMDALVAAAGAESGSTQLAAELRHLGGALARPASGGGALDHLPGGYAGYFVAVAATPELAERGRADAARAVAALQPWSSGRRFSNFTEEPVPATSVFEPTTLARLRAVRAELDPAGMFRANHGLD